MQTQNYLFWLIFDFASWRSWIRSSISSKWWRLFALSKLLSQTFKAGWSATEEIQALRRLKCRDLLVHFFQLMLLMFIKPWIFFLSKSKTSKTQHDQNQKKNSYSSPHILFLSKFHFAYLLLFGFSLSVSYFFLPCTDFLFLPEWTIFIRIRRQLISFKT